MTTEDTRVLTARPIAIVRNGINAVGGGVSRPRWGSVESDLVLDERYTEALDGIEGYSHLLVVFWMHQALADPPMKHHVQNREELPVMGLFATRAPFHPNPIGITAVPLLSRQRNVLRVRGLDALDGTPVVDIKPYTPAFDRVEGAQVPDWVHRIYEQEAYF